MSQKKSIDELEERILRIQRSSGTSWPVFLRLHNWLRMHSRFYYWWHTTLIANPIHTSLLSLIILFLALSVTATLLIAFGYAIYYHIDGFQLVWHTLAGWLAPTG